MTRIRRLTEEEYRQVACEEIAKEPYPDFSEEHINNEAKRLRAQDRWL